MIATPTPWNDDDHMSTSSGQPDFDASIRHIEHEGETWFSMVDVMAFFADTEADARYYWRDTKKRLEADGFDVGEKISHIPLTDKTGKRKQKTDCATGQTVLRIVQSIPSPKAEPIREWLAHLGYEQLEAEVTPGLETERAFQRDIARLQRRGLSELEAVQWIEMRVKQKRGNLAIRDIWKLHGASGWDYATLSNAVMEGATGKTATQLKRELRVSNPRDHLSAAENAAIAGIELFSSILHTSRDSHGVTELTDDIQDGASLIDRDAIQRVFSKTRPDRRAVHHG